MDNGQRPFVHRMRVRYSECDQQGIVFNGHYMFYYNDAYGELFREIGWTRPEITKQGWDVVVAEATLRFRGSARYDEYLDIRLPITHLGATSMIVEPQFVVDGRLCVSGSVRHVFVDVESMSRTSIPDPVRGQLTSISGTC